VPISNVTPTQRSCHAFPLLKHSDLERVAYDSLREVTNVAFTSLKFIKDNGGGRSNGMRTKLYGPEVTRLETDGNSEDRVPV
jgi:hypothetical protein